MRFIGSKLNLLTQIEKVILDNTTGTENIFCDIFSGTSAVARHFKSKYEVHSNDLLHFSYVIQKATIENNKQPAFQTLKSIGITNPFHYLEETTPNLVNDHQKFITQNYAPHSNCQRMYLTPTNALRIDFIRTTLEYWRKKLLVSETEYFYLLASLIESVPSISNITGTYGAYLKTWDKRAFNKLELSRLEVFDNNRNNKSYNKDANILIKELEGDILYLDPPYNSRQYAPNYHLLETISKYDSPEIYGVTGMRPYSELKSSYCIKNEVKDAFEDLISNAKFSNIIMSYSTDGLMSKDTIETILKRHCMQDSFRMYSIPYRQYMSKKTNRQECLYEYLFYIHKDIPQKTVFDTCCLKQSKNQNNYIPTTKKFIKSPMNYIGGKYKLLPQLLPRFPKNIDTFVDLFSGGCNVSINVPANKTICNDINNKIIDFFKTLKATPIEEILSRIEANIDLFDLSKTNEEGFKAFRKYYNTTGNPIDLYTLTCYSFNYQFRFNNQMEYNNPFGRNRSHFSDNMKKNLISFATKLKNLNINFSSKDFREISIDYLTSNDFIYCDPPYYITTGTYNDGNRGFKDWKLDQEIALHNYLDQANNAGVKFALSNVLEHKGKFNEVLLEWSKKYNVIYLDRDYSNSSYNTVKGESKEVLITNY